MAPTTVGSTRVSLTPDLSRFASEMRSGIPPIAEQVGRDAGEKLADAIGRRLAFSMPSAMRDAGKIMLPAATKAGIDAGDNFATGFETKLQARLAKMRPSVQVTVKLQDAGARTQLKELTTRRTVDVVAQMDSKPAKAELDKLTAARTVKITAVVDDSAAKAKLAALTADRTVSITADVDDKAAKAKLAALTKKASATVDVKLAQGAIKAAEKRIARLGAAKVVEIIPKIKESAYKLVERRLDRLTAERGLLIRASVDTRVAADELRNLTRRRRAIVQADADTGAAIAALNHAARNRTALIRVRTLGLPSLNVNTGDGGAGAGMLGGRIAKLAATAALALPQLASLSSAIAQMGPAAAVAAPALSMLIGAFAAIKIGTSGIGEAFKAAFAPADQEARAAATATRQVESAQRSLANAQRSLQDAQVQAADRVRQAQQQVADAERDLSRAQRDASQAQRDLTAARRQAVRDLEDMNTRLKGAQLDQRAATLAVQQAEEDLNRVRSDPRATQLQIQQAELSAEQARQSMTEQRTELKRLQADTAAANKAGVAGSQAVVQARRQMSRADEEVADRQRALNEAQAGVDKARVDGQRQIADAQRQVADAVRQVAEAQENAASQTDKFAEAMAKLSPNARDFVNQVRAMAPAWRGLKLEVQDALFAGLGQRLTVVSRQIIPTLTTGLAGTATELNLMGKSALTAVSNLEKSGQLNGFFDTIRSGLSDLRAVPGQIVTGLAKLTVAAQPAFERITTNAASAMDRAMQSLTAGMESGRLTESINTALDVAVSFGQVLADVWGVVRNIMSAASAGGGDFFAVFGAAVAELRRITAMPEVQAALKQIFTAVQAIASLLATTLGAALRAVLPLLAALAPTVTALAQAFGPVLAKLAQTLGAALLPVVKALAPVIDVVGRGLMQVVTALMPLLAPIGRLIAAIVKALAPVLSTVVAVIVQIVKALTGPLITVVNALVPVVRLFGQLFAGVFKALLPALRPVIGVVGQLAKLFATVFAAAIRAVVPALRPLIPVVVLVVKLLGQLLSAVLKPLTPVITLIATIFGQVLGAAMKVIAPIIKIVADVLGQLLGAFKPLFPVLGELVGAVAELLKPLLQLVMLALKPLLAVIGFVARMLTAGLGIALKAVVPIVVWLASKVAWLATIVTKVVTAILKAFKVLFDKLLGHSIIPDIVRGGIKWFTNLWHRAVAIFNFLKNAVIKIWDTLWGGIKRTASAVWSAVRKGFDAFADGFKNAFSRVKTAIGKIWEGLKALVKAPIKFWIEVVYNRGIVSVWNKTASKIPGVPDLPKMPMPKGFARGGILPGQSSWRQGDDQLVPMRRGEGVYVSEAMRDPYERARLHAVNAAAMAGRSLDRFRGFAEGGILGDLGSTVGKVLGKGADIVRGGIADLAEAAFTPVKAAIGGMDGAKDKGSWPAMISEAPLNLISQAIDYIRGKEEATIGRGRWLRPVDAPYGTRFGVKGRMWSSGRHTGLDFPAKTGTPVRAVAAGRVTAAVSGGPFGPYGKNIQIRHGGEFSSLYAHLSQVSVKIKDAVSAGQRIGKVGATGNVTGPHLHLEARMDGRPIDPMPYLESGGPGGDGGRGVSRWRSTVVTALREVNQSVSLVSTVLRRMNQESGGNPNAVNRYDSNWRAGHPSVGLMQVIRGTFQAYAGRYRDRGPHLYGVSTNPLANIYASMRYALSRYGSLPRAYNRPGGYATGGTARPGELAWVGEQGPELMRVLDDGVRIFPHEQSVRMAAKMGTPVPGYATGGKITVGGKRIDTGPIRASVGAGFLKALAGTAAAISSAMTKVATALKNAFKGVKTTLDDRLIKALKAQSREMQSLADKRDKLRAKISEAKTFAEDQRKAGLSFAALTSLPSSGLPFGAGGIASGLKVRLVQLKAFSKNIGILAKRGLAKELLQQIIAAGPDSGAPYAAALVGATAADLKGINATQKQINIALTGFGNTAADALFDSGKKAGQGFLAGLKDQEKAITNAMSGLAKKIQKAIRSALKMRSPSLVMRGLGRLTTRSYGMGLADEIPRAAATAARMAAVVRSVTAAGTARIENTSSNTYGDRTLNYHATTREVASRQSVLAALAMEDMLHRPVVSGG